MKICLKCQIEKLISEFGKQKSQKDGLYPWCKTCVKERYNSYYLKNKSQILFDNKQWRDNNKLLIKNKKHLYNQQISVKNRTERLVD